MTSSSTIHLYILYIWLTTSLIFDGIAAFIFLLFSHFLCLFVCLFVLFFVLFVLLGA